jgi:GNAT superfamily N-acetyltransferase
MIKLKDILREGNKALSHKLELLQTTLKQKFPEIQELEMYIKSDNSLFLNSLKIKVEKRHQGIGKNVVGEIKKFADENNLIIILAPEAEPGYKKKLDSFYKQLGFVSNKGRKRDYRLASSFGSTMYRRPGVNEGDKEDFMNHNYTGGLASNTYEKTVAPGAMASRFKKSRYPELLSKEQCGPYEVEFRQSGEVLKYVAHDSNGEILRNGNDIVYMTPEEIKRENLPEKDTTIVAFVGDKAVGIASNEWGAVGIWVDTQYHRAGIGTALLEKHVEQRPTLKSGIGKLGQMTQAGYGMTQKYYDKMEKKHGKDWFAKLIAKHRK